MKIYLVFDNIQIWEPCTRFIRPIIIEHPVWRQITPRFVLVRSLYSLQVSCTVLISKVEYNFSFHWQSVAFSILIFLLSAKVTKKLDIDVRLHIYVHYIYALLKYGILFLPTIQHPADILYLWGELHEIKSSVTYSDVSVVIHLFNISDGLTNHLLIRDNWHGNHLELGIAYFNLQSSDCIH